MHKPATLPPAATRVLLSFLLPITGGVALQVIVSLAMGIPSNILPGEQSGASLLLAGAGATSLFLGLRWHGLRPLGLRGHRSLYAGIGFATLGWIVYIVARVFVVSSYELPISPNLARVFVYLFLFEALSLQLWAFGLLFRSVADWRGPLTAAISSGLLFGVVGFLFFDESFIADLNSIFFFLAWGLFYGLVRLRTGGILGTVIVQAMQSLTTWHILLPEARPRPNELHTLYAATATFYLIFIWRLWPKEEADYRV